MSSEEGCQSASRKLYKFKTGKVIDGVCRGVASYFNMDVTLIRILFVMAMFFQGAGAVVYLLAMIFLPEAPEEDKGSEENEMASDKLPIWIGGGFIAFGLLLLIKPWTAVMMKPLWPFWFHYGVWGNRGTVLPFFLILAGMAYIVHVLRQHQKADLTDSRHNQWTKTSDGKLIAGVLAGLAQKWKKDAALIRVLFMLIAWLTHPLLWLLFYVACCFILPQDDKKQRLEEGIQ